MKTLITSEWLKDKAENEPAIPFEVIHKLRVCDFCNLEIEMPQTGISLKNKLYHSGCVYKNP